MTTDETGQGILFSGLPDAPKAPEPPDAFRSQVGGLVERAQAAMLERREREAAEAEEAARLADLDAAAAAMAPPEMEAAEPENAAPEAPSPVDNVIPLRKERQRKGDGRGDFFAIDHRLWAKVCGLGLNAAVAYLVLARGTGGDNRTSSWSVNAIREYTGIGPKRAAEALALLEKAGLLSVLKNDSRPRRRLAAANELASYGDVRPGLDSYEVAVLADLKRMGGGPRFVPKTTRYGQEWSLSSPYKHAVKLAAKGYLRDAGAQKFAVIEAAPGVDSSGDYEPDWTWLPNAVVDGAADEPSPLERIRQLQSLPALRVFVDLYHSHDLDEDGGISWAYGAGIRQKFERFAVGQQGPYAVWGFRRGTYTAWATAAAVAPHFDQGQPEGKRATAFFDALSALEKLGLVEPIAHLVESAESETAERIHPLPVRGTGEPAEQALAEAALRASRALVTMGQWEWAVGQGAIVFAPQRKVLENVAVVGILRLRYRPRTNATQRWYAMTSDWLEMAEHYEAIRRKAEGEQSATSRDIKGHQG